MINKNMTVDEAILGRKSVRVYDTEYKINRDEMLAMIEKATRAPSSVNMQPWRFVVVDTAEGKETLRPLIRFNQRQNDSSSAMILVFGDLECYRHGEEIVNEAYARGFMPKEIRDREMEKVIPMYENMSRERMTEIVKVDASLAAMQLVLVARNHGYETNIIGGFEADQLADAFDLDASRYVPVMIIAMGKGIEEGYETVRLAAENITYFK